MTEIPARSAKVQYLVSHITSETLTCTHEKYRTITAEPKQQCLFRYQMLEPQDYFHWQHYTSFPLIYWWTSHIHTKWLQLQRFKRLI